MSSAVAVKVIKPRPLVDYQKAAVNRMLEAAGVELVVRAMTRTCKPKYENKGWANCWFTQMFGGKANLDRMTESMGLAGDYESAIAEKLGIDEDEVNTVIGLFDDHTYNEQTYDETTGEYTLNESVVETGKVVSFLEYVSKWLSKKGVTLLDITTEAHRRARKSSKY